MTCILKGRGIASGEWRGGGVSLFEGPKNLRHYNNLWPPKGPSTQTDIHCICGIKMSRGSNLEKMSKKNS